MIPLYRRPRPPPLRPARLDAVSRSSKSSPPRGPRKGQRQGGEGFRQENFFLEALSYYDTPPHKILKISPCF